ncbi:transglutaminaseTgpA domain-containing protein [Actinoplanes solisilvae]|uniref:transglutaminase family protein n=1 Tax=Actinoplanes solisilvae TaxID=2486853 RepID=UPI000FDB5DC0|nr:transglutaminase domain-containing protein [Actinoplanes solisilvae]
MVKWVLAAALAGMITLAGVALGRIFVGALLVELIAGAAVASVGVSLACRRLPNWVVAPLSAVLLGGYTVAALRIAASRAEMIEPLAQVVRESVVNGIPRLLTAMIPVEPTPETVVVPVIAAWLAGLAGAEVALRAGRVLLGLVPVVGLYAGALYVVGPNAGSAVETTLGFAALAVVTLAVGSARPAGKAPKRWRAIGGTTVVLALVAAVGPWIGSQVGAVPVDPRRYVEPPQVDSLDESPLNRISGWALTPKLPLLKVSPAAAPGKRVRLRLAVLPDYDGVTWRVGAIYRNAGRVLPAPPKLPDAQVTEVRQTVVVEGLTGRLLPVVPTPTGVDGARVAFDAATGTMIRPEGLQPGLTYAVKSELQTPDLNLLPSAEVPSGDAVARYLAVGGAEVPEQIQRLADQLAQDNGAAFDRAAAIEEFLGEHYRKVADAPSGHALPNLSFFLFGARQQGGQVGTSEQFAASFALLARLTGLPSRVVVGFDAPAAGGIVTAAHALAWPEVLFDGLGWVAFDPMPESKDPRPVEEDFTPEPTKPPSPPSEAPTPSASVASSQAAAAPGPEAKGGPSAGLIAGGVPLVVLFAAAGIVVLLRGSLRRRRLTEGGPDERIAGAWAEFRDALRLTGQPVPAHFAATEAAAYAQQAAPDDLPPLDHLVAGINTVGFAPGAADDGQAARAGEQAVAYAEALRSRRSWWRRLWWSIHPGPLRWRR